MRRTLAEMAAIVCSLAGNDYFMATHFSYFPAGCCRQEAECPEASTKTFPFLHCRLRQLRNMQEQLPQHLVAHPHRAQVTQIRLAWL